ncbi:MAG: DUF7487 domain-containing protein [Elusimicrobiota bacterium]
MAKRKVFNYDSEILVDMTIDKEGYSPDKYGDSSAKFIWAKCRFCGEPHRLRKAFYNRAGSACHKQCRIKEQKQQISPFSDPKVREKAKQTNLKKYGVKQASQNKKIAKKISDTKQTKKYKERIQATNKRRYGVENVFQSEEVKAKIKETKKKKYGYEHHAPNKKIRNQTQKTCIKNFGVDNPMKDTVIKQKAIENYHKAISESDNNHYRMINILNQNDFWELMRQGKSLRELSYIFNIKYESLASTLSKEQFSEKYSTTYSYPSNQTQKNIVKKISKFYKKKILFNTRKIIPPYELDIYMPQDKVAIEFNGSFWHSECMLPKNQARNKHYNKTKICEEKKIRLIHIFEHQWIEREKQILNFIRSSLGANSIKIPARKCKITNSNESDFMEEYHIQGKPRGTLQWFNLVYNNKTVASMTAGKHHEKGGDTSVCVLNRLVFKKDRTVQGGASRLFKYFKQWAIKNGYRKIISWSDTSISYGNIYKVLGFTLDKEHRPGYFYYDTKNHCYIKRQSRRKYNKQRPKGVTIADWNQKDGLYRIWDCGKRSFVYDLQSDIIKKIQDNLTPDLLKKEFVDVSKNKYYGHCYVASECFYHLMGGKGSDYQPMILRTNGISHWFLRHKKTDQIIDITVNQFDDKPDYTKAKNCSFLTSEPSKRTKILIERIN